MRISNYKPVPMWKYNYKLLMNKLSTLPRAGHPKPTSAELDQDVFRLKQTNPIVTPHQQKSTWYQLTTKFVSV